MNDPRTTTVVGDVVVEAFPVNDKRALRAEVDAAKGPPLDQELRDALVVIVRTALERLARDPEEWLPDAMVARPKEALGFFVLIEMGHVHDEVLRLRANAEGDFQARLADLERLAGEVS